MNLLQLLFLAALAVQLLTAHGYAGTHTWTGNGANGLWSTAANWENNSPPFANESQVGLIFPASANRRTSTNNLGGLQVSALLMDGGAYTLRGSGAGTNITLLPGGLFGAVVASGGLGHTLDTSLNFTLTGTNVFTVGPGASLGVAARLTGSGSLRKGGDGSLRLRSGSANSYSGITEVVLGDLELASAGGAVPGHLFIGQTNSPSAARVRLFTSEQIANAAPVTIHENGELLLNIFNETIGPLTLFAGVVDTGTGILTPKSVTGIKSGTQVAGNSGELRGALQLSASTTNTFAVLGGKDARMDVKAQLRGGTTANPATLAKLGIGWLYLYASNSFNGPLQVREGDCVAAYPSALGSTNFGATVWSNATLYLNNVVVPGKALMLESGGQLQARSSSWTGPVNLAGHANIFVEKVAPGIDTLTLSGKISGPGGFTKTGPGVLVLNGTSPNTYTGLTRADQGELRLSNGPGFNVPAIPGALRIGGISAQSEARVTALATGQLSTQCSLEVNRYGVFDVQNYAATVAHLAVNNGGRVIGTTAGALLLNGPLASTNSVNAFITAQLHLGPKATNVWIDSASLIIEGALHGAGSPRWDKSGGGTLALRGDGSYAGRVHMGGGNVVVDSHLPMVSFDLPQLNKLHGTGQVAQVNFLGGWLNPTPAVHPFRVSELVATNLGLIELSINDAATYARIACSSQPKLDGRYVLFFSLIVNFHPPNNQSFTLLQNDSALPISGTFKDTPEGGFIKVGTNQYFQVTYHGGDGNDFVVTKVPAPIAATLQPPVRLVVENKIQLDASGTPGAWYEIQASENLNNPAGWHSIGHTLAQSNGTLSFVDTTAGDHPIRFYRFQAN